jgi:KDO2-lipid IV(A) lauroyltransferase
MSLKKILAGVVVAAFTVVSFNAMAEAEKASSATQEITLTGKLILKEGKVLAILSDVRGKTDALPIKFLGKTANVAEGMGFIAHQTNVPVFPTIITRIGWGLHSYRVYDPIFPDSKAGKRDDALRITQSFFDILSKHVENEPEQWFWFNKRWIFDPLKKDKAESQESGVGIQNQGNPDKNGGNDNEDSSTSSAS